ncbi:hypothetical protein AAZX31_20G066800 [Glycine max]
MKILYTAHIVQPCGIFVEVKRNIIKRSFMGILQVKSKCDEWVDHISPKVASHVDPLGFF